MLGRLQQRKIEHVFNILDRDKSGFLELADFTGMATNLAKVRGIEHGTDTFTGMKQSVEGWFHHTREAADSDGDGRISLEEWLAFWSGWCDMIAKEVDGDERPALTELEGSAEATFMMLDSNNDGEITLDEYRDWLSGGMSMEADMEKSFGRLDVEGNGRLTRERIVTLVKEFYLTNDPTAPGNHLYGLLY